MALGTKEHLNRQVSKHCNYKNENQQSFFQIKVLLSHDSTWNCKQSTYFSQLLGKEILLIGHEVHRWGMKIFVLAMQGGGKSLFCRRENSQLISCIFLRETLKTPLSDGLNPQKIYQKTPQTTLNLHFLWVNKFAPRKFISILKILQDKKSVSKLSIRHRCEMLGLVQILELD